MVRSSILFTMVALTTALPASAQISAEEEVKCVFPRCSYFGCDANDTIKYTALAGLPENALDLAATNHTVAENIRAVSSCLHTPFYDYTDSEKNPYAFLVQLHYVIGPDELRHKEKPSTLCFIYEVERGDMSSTPAVISEDGSEPAPQEVLKNHAYLTRFDFARASDNLFATSTRPAWEDAFSPTEQAMLASTKKLLASASTMRSDDLPSSAQWYLKGKDHPVLKSAEFKAFLKDKKKTLPFADCLK